MSYSFRLAARVLLYASSHRQDNTYHSLWYTSEALAGTRNSSMGPPHEGSIRRPIEPWANTLTTELHLAPRHRVNDNSDSERENLLPPHWLLFQQGFFYMHHPTERITHTTAFVTPVMKCRPKWEIAKWVHHEGSIRRPIAPWANTLTMELHLILIITNT